MRRTEHDLSDEDWARITQALCDSIEEAHEMGLTETETQLEETLVKAEAGHER